VEDFMFSQVPEKGLLWAVSPCKHRDISVSVVRQILCKHVERFIVFDVCQRR
jgi:hypothetical protein